VGSVDSSAKKGKLILKFPIILAILIMLTIIAPVSAIQTQVSLDRTYYYPGETGIVSVTFFNEQLQSSWNASQIGVHFDWMKINTWFSLPSIVMSPGGVATVAVPFSVPNDVTAGDHSFSIQYINSELREVTLQTWSVSVHDPNEPFPGLWALIVVSPIVGYTLSITGIIITVIVGLFARRTRREISYELLSMSPILNLEDEVKDSKLKITYDSKRVTNVYLTELSVANAGNTAITKADYIDPITIGFGAKSRVLTADKSEARPSELEIGITLEKGRMVLTPCVISRNEFEMFKILVTDPEPDTIEVTGRIVDTKIAVSTYGRGTSISLMLLAVVFLALFAISNLPRSAPGPIPNVLRSVCLIAVVLLPPFAVRKYRHFGRDFALLRKNKALVHS
jgi:hypothetical protein